jgi:uncharacterized repeat protein (TIGR02543 family)
MGCDDSATKVKEDTDGDQSEVSELIDLDTVELDQPELDQPEPRCDDGLLNGDETDVDCGGACVACGDDKACQTDADCISLNCDNELDVCLAPSCDDGRHNGDETDVDCGGACLPCGLSRPCLGDEDCAVGTCLNGYCQAEHCGNGALDGDESDLDCGGSCAPCGTDAQCTVPADCDSGVCSEEGVCIAASCEDGVLNGAELDLDCGGDCGPCPDGSTCVGNDDCVNGSCVDDICQLAFCANGVLDDGESDVDCGGDCPACGSGSACELETDCLSGYCVEGVCADGVLVHFDAQGGSEPEPMSMTVILGQAYGELPVSSREGYGFAGWYTEMGGMGTLITAETLVEIDVEHTLYASWTGNPYTVSFDAQGGSEPVPASLQVSFGAAYGELASSSRDGYGFGGWYTEPNGQGERITDASIVSIANDHTLYAFWDAGSYTVSFDPQGGTPTPDSVTLNFGAPYGELPVVSREGYTFAGWWTEAEGGEQITALSLVQIPNDHTLYAHWSANEYTVSFDAQGGSTPVPETKTVSYEQPYGELAMSSREGYTFAGWYTRPNGAGAEVTDATIVSTTADHTLYAHWTANDYTVAFDAQGGVSPVPASKLVSFDAPYGSLANTTREGYSFAGWWTEAGGAGTEVTDSTMVSTAADHTLYAHWTPNSYTVRFDAQGGTADPTEMTVTFDAAYGALATASREGYSFDGWFTEPAGAGSRIIDSSIVSIPNDHSLYANWIANSYRVDFDAQGGSEPDPASMVVTFGEAYGALATTSRSGYSFDGWWTEAGGAGTEVTDATLVSTASVHTLYAKWVANDYTLSFDAQGGSATPTEKTVTFDAAYGTLATATRTGYTFDGWWTGADGAGTQVLDSTIVSTDADHTVYAKWLANSYTVSFDGNGGGTPNPETKSVTFDAPYGALATVSRTGYTFAGWFTEAVGGTQVLDTTTVSTASDHSLYAHWTANTYTVSFDANGGGTPDPLSKVVTFDAAYGALASINRPGYTFNGWYTAAVGGSEVLPATIVSTSADHTLYARWTANTYTVSFDANGGGTPDPLSKVVTFDAAYGPLATVSRTGYTFAGWWTTASGGTQVQPSSIVDTASNHTLYAHWTANSYTVTFNGNGGGTPNPTSKSVTFDQPYGGLATVSRTGYTFAGWFTAAVGGTQVQPSTNVGTASNHSLYAHWTANTYTVSFDANGGGTPDPLSKVVTFDAAYGALASINRPGYTFNGWWTAATGGTEVVPATLVNTASNHTLYAHWTPNTYTVTFDGNLGGTPTPSTRVVTFGAPYASLSTVTRTGYTFAGWWTAATGGTQVLTTTTVTTASDHTLYAHWSNCNGVTYSGYCYEALDGTSYNSWTAGCQATWLSLPAGWSLVPYSSAIETNVVRAYPWGTHVMVFAGGEGYGTANYSAGLWNLNMLGVSGSTYKPNSCHLRILIRRAL